MNAWCKKYQDFGENIFLLDNIKAETIEILSHQDQAHRTPHRGPTCQDKGLTKKGVDP